MSLRLNSMIEYQALVARMKGKDAPPAATAIPEEAPRKSKFNAVITEALGIKFHSKKEARYYLELVCRQKAGEIKYFLMQVPFRLPGNAKHLLDFMIVHSDDSIEYVEVKGKDLPMGKMKRNQVEEIYGIRITVV